jgi:uncharacterized protein
MYRFLGFLFMWGMGLWPHVVPLHWAALGAGLFFVVFPRISRMVGAGGYPELGVSLHTGWSRNLTFGLVAGCIFPLALFAVLYGTGRLAPIGWVSGSQLLGKVLFVFVQTCYIGFWEELLNRGYLLRVLPDRLHLTATLVVVGLVFSAFHLPRFGAPVSWWVFWFVSGIMFTLPVLVTGSLWFSIGVHWGFDLIWFYLLVDDGLLRYGPAGTSVLNSGTVPLVGVVLFVPLIWRLALWANQASPR